MLGACGGGVSIASGDGAAGSDIKVATCAACGTVDSQSGHLSFETGEGDMNSGSIRLLTGKSTTTGGGGIHVGR